MEEESEEKLEDRRELMGELPLIDQEFDSDTQKNPSSSKHEDNAKLSRSTENRFPSDLCQIRFDTSETSRSVSSQDTCGNQQQEQSTSKASTSRHTKNADGAKKLVLELFPTYKKRPGTKDKGREFEQIMCAYYALKLAIHKGVDDFNMTSNDVNDGKFDDICIKVTCKRGTSRRFLFQLKHKENRNIDHTALEREKGDFNLHDYIKSISELKHPKDAVFILSTNSSLTIEGDNIELNNGISLEKCKQLKSVGFLINTEENPKNFTFKIKNKNLKEKFYLFTSQLNVKQTEEKVKRLLPCDIFGAFTSYIRSWWLGRFVLTKHDVLAKITELALSPYIKRLKPKNFNKKTNIIAKAITSFPLTVVEECDESLIEKILEIKKSWTDEDISKAREKYGLKEDQTSRILWYLGKLPLVVRFDDLNERTNRVMSLLRQNMGNKKIVLCGKVPKSDFKVDTLYNLSDLVKRPGQHKYLSKMMKTFRISLQDRQSVTLGDLMNIDPDIAKLIGMRELLQMSQKDPLLIGNRKEQLPDSHIPRTVSPVFVKTQEILKFHKSSRDSLIIINCDEKFQTELPEDDMNTMELAEYTTTEDTNVILLSTKDRCNNDQFEEIVAKSPKPNAYLFQHFDEELCILILQKGRKLEVEFADTLKTVNEAEILAHYSNPLHVLCAPPGMGKSTLMKILYNTCPSDCLAVYVNLIQHNSFLEEKPVFNTIWDRFLQPDGDGNDLLKQMMEHFTNKRKLYMFLDGLDELNSQHVEIILSFAKIASKGVNVWISSRENLREMLCQRLNVVPIDIKGLNRKEQKTYILQRLEQGYETEKIEKIASAVFNSADLNNSQNLLGIPLQLHIITEMFLNDERVYEKLEQRNIFVLSKMYKTFFKGKIRFAVNKVLKANQQQQLGYLEYVLQAYEIPALKACLDKQDLERLNLKLETKEVKKFLHEMRTQGDKYGIIKLINQNDEAIFDHQTYAEYFACLWLTKHRNKAALLKDRIFNKRYENLRLIFDIFLAEHNPLHLSIIYKDIKQFQEHINEIDRKDEAGRTVYHLAFSFGQKYRPGSKNKDDYIMELTTLKRETPFYVRMIEILLDNGEIPKDRDILFDSDCISYAFQAGCLYPIEKILEKELLPFSELEGPLDYRHHRMALAYCAAQCGYPHLLSELIKRSPRLVNDKEVAKDLVQFSVRGCNGDVCTPPRQGNVEAVKILMEETDPEDLSYILEEACMNKRFDVLEILITVEAQCCKGNTILHLLVLRCPEKFQDEINSVIQKFQIDVNAQNHLGATALHFAASNSDLKIILGLMENGAELHILDSHRRSALHYATNNSRQEVIEFFLNHQLAVNGQDRDGVTPLHSASEGGRTDIVQLLFDHGADPNLTDKENNNALHYALTKFSSNTQDTMELLIRKGVDVNARNEEGMEPAHMAYQAGDFKTADFLLNSGATADINARFQNGETLLHKAFKNRNIPDALELLERGADPNLLDGDNRNALYYCLTNCYERKVVHAVLNRGVDPNVRYQYGRTLLQIACLECDTKAVIQLVGKSADLNILDDLRRNPIHNVFESFEEKKKLVIDELLENANHFDTNIQHEHESYKFSFSCERCMFEIVSSLEEEADYTSLIDGLKLKVFMTGSIRMILNILTNSLGDNDAYEMLDMVASWKLLVLVCNFIESGLEVNKRDIFGKRELDYASEWEQEYPGILDFFRGLGLQGCRH